MFHGSFTEKCPKFFNGKRNVALLCCFDFNFLFYK